jgi:hypothetical protein
MNQTNEVKTLGKMDVLILFVLLAFTSAGTAGLVAVASVESGLLLIVRQVAAVCFTDGVILYWAHRRMKLPDAKQRELANYAMWAGVGVVLLFTVAYGAESVLLDGAQGYFVDAGLGVMPLGDFIGFAVSVILGAQAAGTLGLILYIEQLDPRVKMALLKKEAEDAIAQKQLQDYKTAQEAISGTVGQARALAALRTQLDALGYSEREREALVRVAVNRIQDNRADGITALPAQGVPLFAANLETDAVQGGASPSAFFESKPRKK